MRVAALPFTAIARIDWTEIMTCNRTPIVARSIRRAGTLAFGGYPISRRMGPRYLAASRAVSRIIAINDATAEDLSAVSDAKGMYNRVLRQDSPDWEAVRQLLGSPDRAICNLAAIWLKDLRELIKDDLELAEHCNTVRAKQIGTVLKFAALALEEAGFRETENEKRR